jgi:hypothetical protein
VKKLAKENNTLSSTAYYSSTADPAGTHWRIADWDLGVTEPGSSGSALFDATSHRIVGDLSGGDAACSGGTDNNAPDWFGKLSYSWGNNGATDSRRRLRDWLDPNNTGIISVAGKAPCKKVSFTTSTATMLEGTNCSVTTLTLNLAISAAPTVNTTATITASGTANSSDYSLSSTSVLFPSGSAANRTVTLTIQRDAVVEPNETIILTISSVAGDAIVGTTNTYTLTLRNDDRNPDAHKVLANQTIFSDNFDAIATGLGSWSRITYSGGTNLWIVGSNGGTGFTNKSAYISNNASAYSYTATTPVECDLASPVINATNYENLQLTFTYKCNGELDGGVLYDYGTLWYSVNGGTNWTKFGGDLQGVTTATTTTVALPVAANNASNLKIAFSWSNDNSVANLPPFGVDNVILRGDTYIAEDIQTAVNTSSGFAENDLGPNQTLHFYDTNTANIMATIQNQSAHDYGCTKVEVERAGTGAQFISGESDNLKKIFDKTFAVRPEINNVSGAYTITYYLTSGEKTGWETESRVWATQGQLFKTAGSVGAMNTGTVREMGTSVTRGTFNGHHTITASFSSGFSGFGIGNPGSGAPLPIELLSFVGQFNGQYVELSWLTANELQNKGFEIERSIDGVNFEKIGFVAGKGNSQERQIYAFPDHHYNTNHYIHYYRLKQIDFNGSFQYSLIVQVKINKVRPNFTVQPNPFDKEIVLQFNKEIESDVFLKLIDVTGREIYRNNLNGQNKTKFDISVPSLPAGIYFLYVQVEGIAYTVKVIKE